MSTTPGDDRREPSTWAPVASPPPAEGQPAPATPPPATPQGWGTPVPPPPGGYPPPAGTGPAPAGHPGGWRPPVLQPGIVPLRPLGLGEILDGAVRAIRANPAVMFGLSAAAVAIAVLLQALIRVSLAPAISAQISAWLDDTAYAAALGSETGNLSDLYGSSLGELAALPLTQLVITILTGLLIVSVSRSVLGETITVAEVVRNARVWWVLGFTFLAGLASILVVGGAIALLVTLLDAQSWGALAATVLILVPVLVVATVWFTVRTMLVPPALMLEGRGFWFTVARAWRLTRGSFWRLLGISVLVSVMVGVVSSAVQIPVSVIAQVVTGDATGLSVASVGINSVGEAITLTLTTTYQAAVTALLYIDVRMRREGLDLELGQAAAARTA